MIPNMSDTLTEWEQPVKLKITSTATVDFVETKTVLVVNKRAVVQVAEKQKLNIGSIDWSKSYKLIHSKFPIDINQFVEYSGKDFKVVSLEDYDDYGYYAAIGEETKKDLLVAT